MRGQGYVLLVAFGALFVGAVFFKGVADAGPSDPTASAKNGAPRGLLALALWLSSRGEKVILRSGFDEALPEAPAVLVVPPPEGSDWTEGEVAPLFERVRAGTLDVVLLCDEAQARRRRLSAWLKPLGMECQNVGGESRASGTMPGYVHSLWVREGGRVTPAEAVPSVPAFVDEAGGVLVVRAALGQGLLTVIGSASVFANDGLAKGDNAAFALSLLASGRPIVFDEAHHGVRSAAVLEEAFGRLGPKVAGVALLLLIPVVLLGFFPRPGDPPPKVAADRFAAAERAARALAALYETAGIDLGARAGRDEVDPTRRQGGSFPP